MKKINTLLSFLIAFSFVTVAFGQEEDALARTTPVISSSGGNSSGGPQKTMQIKWNVVNVKGNSVTLKLTKSIDCAMLQSITATTDKGVILNISYNPNDLKGLKTGVQKSVTVKFLEDFVDKKVSIGLSWDLKGCNETTLGLNDKTKQPQVKSLVASSSTPSKPSGGSYSSNDNFNVILKADVGVKSGTTTNAVEKRKDQVSTIRSTENDKKEN
jgi:hypothetical protein